MVSEIQIDDKELEEQLLKEVHENGTMATSGMVGFSCLKLSVYIWYLFRNEIDNWEIKIFQGI